MALSGYLCFHRMVTFQRCFLWCSGVGHIARPSANQLAGLQRGGTPWLSLAVCPSAACSSPCGAKVPRAIACWLTVLRQSARHCGVHLFVHAHREAIADSTSKGPCRGFTSLGSSGTISSSHTRGSNCMQRPSILRHFGKVGLFSSAVPSRTSLTWRSSGTPTKSLTSARPCGRPLPLR